MKWQCSIIVRVLVIMIGIPGCAQQSNQSIPKKEIPSIPVDKESCEEAGGIWGQIGLARIEKCNLPT